MKPEDIKHVADFSYCFKEKYDLKEPFFNLPKVLYMYIFLFMFLLLYQFELFIVKFPSQFMSKYGETSKTTQNIRGIWGRLWQK